MKTQNEYEEKRIELFLKHDQQYISIVAALLASAGVIEEMRKDAEKELPENMTAREEALVKNFRRVIANCQCDLGNIAMKLIDIEVERRLAPQKSRKEVAINAGMANAERYTPIAEYALKLATTGRYRSRRNAAISIAGEVITFAKANGVTLSQTQAPTTIEGWLKDRGYTPSSSKHTRSSS
jgi:hypothetical protein